MHELLRKHQEQSPIGPASGQSRGLHSKILASGGAYYPNIQTPIPGAGFKTNPNSPMGKMIPPTSSSILSNLDSNKSRIKFSLKPLESELFD